MGAYEGFRDEVGGEFDKIRMPHMALLRNLRGIFSEVRDGKRREDVLEALKKGVEKGRQFPFRYLSAWKAADAEERPWAGQVKRACWRRPRGSTAWELTAAWRPKAAYGYRTSILYGWTGKALIFADAMRRTWDEIESR